MFIKNAKKLIDVLEKSNSYSQHAFKWGDEDDPELHVKKEEMYLGKRNMPDKGTPADINGHCKVIFKKRLKKFLNLSRTQFERLHCPPGWQATPDEENYIEKEEVIGVLENFCRTRKIDWNYDKDTKEKDRIPKPNRRNIQSFINVLKESESYSAHGYFWYLWNDGKTTPCHKYLNGRKPFQNKTPACIKGHYYHYFWENQGRRQLNEFLGITYRQMFWSLTQPEYRHANCLAKPGEQGYITKDRTIKMFENLSKTGRVVWGHP